MKQAQKFISALLLISQQPQSYQTTTEQNWNNGVFTAAGDMPDYYITHDYFTAYQTNAGPSEVLSSATSVPSVVYNYLTNSVQNAGVPSKPFALTEWNIFSQGSQQMVSYVAGMHAVLTMNELMKNKFGIASRWDLANGWDNGNDHGMFSQGESQMFPCGIRDLRFIIITSCRKCWVIVALMQAFRAQAISLHMLQHLVQEKLV